MAGGAVLAAGPLAPVTRHGPRTLPPPRRPDRRPRPRGPSPASRAAPHPRARLPRPRRPSPASRAAPHPCVPRALLPAPRLPAPRPSRPPRTPTAPAARTPTAPPHTPASPPAAPRARALAPPRARAPASAHPRTRPSAHPPHPPLRAHAHPPLRAPPAPAPPRILAGRPPGLRGVPDRAPSVVTRRNGCRQEPSPTGSAAPRRCPLIERRVPDNDRITAPALLFRVAGFSRHCVTQVTQRSVKHVVKLRNSAGELRQTPADEWINPATYA
ncbi:hypothetical protein A4G23_01934 [Streptomyces rubrolavendulae]|uniref:Uncharacterized protein n=1 Tax=Streptomyces rubrolavendulae TaxID=285473 RepID=A0A1D8G0X7_9ACTN|nr:hypothetical protein A4G23_01934 [Streptomyces rubrolavendulae]